MACMPTHACMQVHEVAAALQGRLNGSMCGDSALGLWSPDALGMQALADLAAFGERATTARCPPLGATLPGKLR